MNTKSKYHKEDRFLKKLGQVSVDNAELAKGDLVDEVYKLKKQNRKTLSSM